MIVKSTFRRSKGIEAHLQRSDTNERVAVRHDLFRGPSDLNLCLRFMDGISRSNQKTIRSFIHVIIAPSQDLDDGGVAICLAMIENEFGIAPDGPRVVVQHVKGLRPDHYHAVYSIVDLQTGRAIPSQDSYATDELISRRLELKLGEAIVPGPRLKKNIQELRRRGAEADAEKLGSYVKSGSRDELSRKDRQQATRLDTNPVSISADVFRLFERTGRDLAALPSSLAEAGYSIGRGDKAILVIEEKTGYETSLVRCLRREAKAAGLPIELKEQDLARAFTGLAPKAAARDAGLARAHEKAGHSLDAEWHRAVFEAAADGDLIELEAYHTKRKKQQEKREEENRRFITETLKARREAIDLTYSRADVVRRVRVDRAFRAAQIFDSPALRRLAYAFATTGLLMTGASLVMALVGGSLVVGAMPSLRQARRFRATAELERIQARTSRNERQAQVYRETKQDSTRPKKSVRFIFEQVPKADRVLAGLYSQAWLRTGGIDAHLPSSAVKAAIALGPEITAGLQSMLDRGSMLQVRRLTHWYTGIAVERREQAVRAALCREREDVAVRGGETLVADVPDILSRVAVCIDKGPAEDTSLPVRATTNLEPANAQKPIKAVQRQRKPYVARRKKVDRGKG